MNRRETQLTARWPAVPDGGVPPEISKTTPFLEIKPFSYVFFLPLLNSLLKTTRPNSISPRSRKEHTKNYTFLFFESGFSFDGRVMFEICRLCLTDCSRSVLLYGCVRFGSVRDRLLCVVCFEFRTVMFVTVVIVSLMNLGYWVVMFGLLL